MSRYRIRIQFRLRTLMLLVLVICLVSSWVFYERRRIVAKRETLAKVGNVVIYREQPSWRRFLFGDDEAGSAIRFDANPQFDDASLKLLAESPYLERLILVRTQITDAGLAYLKSNDRLQELELDGTRIDGSGLRYLRGLFRLQALTLVKTLVNDAGISGLAGMHQLKWLEVSDTQITDAGLDFLKDLKNLDALYLNGWPGLIGKTPKEWRTSRCTPARVAALQKSLPDTRIEY